jgi:ribonucleoside-triphosphate reductase
MTDIMISNFFKLNDNSCKILKEKKPDFGFNGLGELVFYRTYSRRKEDGTQEDWADTIIRVVNGIFSIRKDHSIKKILEWNEDYWQNYATKFAFSMFDMNFLPPGRGLWACGTDFVSKYGSAALNNCGYIDTKDLVYSAEWVMNMLMLGVGCGYNTEWKGKCKKPDKNDSYLYVIGDTRQEWAKSVRLLLNTYVNNTDDNTNDNVNNTDDNVNNTDDNVNTNDNTNNNKFVKFDYSKIRPKGEHIKGFGGISSGPEPLLKLHERLELYMDNLCDGKTDHTRTVVDVMNSIGACVVSGNVRRSALISLGSINDETFLDLKDYKKYPERADIGWMSNNSVLLKETKDFEKLPEIAERIKNNGEPGFINLKNIQRYARYGEFKNDDATGCNPCSEMQLESGELCCLSEVFPTRCEDENTLIKACEYATFYASTVTLLPTHSVKTNQVMLKNRRIGVGMSGIADWLDDIGSTKMTKLLRKCYDRVKRINYKLSVYGGIRESVRCSTVKPSGSISLLAGVSPGIHFPTFNYYIRRIRISTNSLLVNTLQNANIPNEKDTYSDNTLVFEFPVCQHGTRKATEVSAWEQFSLLAMMQREWSDNMVSATIYFNPETESNQVEFMLAQFAPIIKSASMLPHTKHGVYAQSPYEQITKEEYEERLSKISKIDWSLFRGDGELPKFCTNDTCR